MLRFELNQLAHQGVELGVCYFRSRVDVVELFVSADFAAQSRDAVGRVHQLPVAREDVIGERGQRIAFVAGREDAEVSFGGFAKFHRTFVGVLD